MKNKWVGVLVVAVSLCVAGGLSAQTVSGQIGNLYSTSFTLSTGQGFMVSAKTIVTTDGTAAAYGDLSAGMSVAVDYAACGMKLPCATRIAASSGSVQKTTTTTSQTKGEVASVQSSTFALASGEGFNVSSTTAVSINGAKAAYSSLAPGMSAVVDWTTCKSANYLPCASQITASGTATATKTSNLAKGTIGSLATSYFTLTTGQTFLVNSSTKVSYNGTATSYGNLKTGLTASVSFADCGSKYPCASSIAASDPTQVQK